MSEIKYVYMNGMEPSPQMPTLEELATTLNALMVAYKELSLKIDSRTSDIEAAVSKVVNLIELRCSLSGVKVEGQNHESA